MVMKPIGDTFLSPSASAASAAWRARALEKTSATSDLRGEGQDEPERKSPQGHKESQLRMRRNGTAEDVPLRHDPRENAPRLTAAFTAQLLGQILPDPERRPSADRFYGREPVSFTLGFDAKL